MQVDIDIVVYAVIAALLLGRLWAVLGTRNDNDPQRQNPFMPPPKLQQQDDEAFNAQQTIVSRVQPVPPPPRSLAGGLAAVKSVDPGFDEKAFLQEARDIFTSVVGAFSAGRLTAVMDFLSPALSGHFQKAIDTRTAAGQTAHTRIVKMKDAEVVSARAENNEAAVTVRFVSDQENTLRDSKGTPVGGGEGKVEEITDTWTFARDVKTPGSKWIVVETKV